MRQKWSDRKTTINIKMKKSWRAHMTKENTTTERSFKDKLLDIAAYKIKFTEKFLGPVMLLITRIYIGNIFFKSGLTKLNPDTTTALFEYEYIPAWEANATKTFFGTEINFPVPSAEFAAMSSMIAELFLPILLFLGFGARLGALGLLGMTFVIEIFVYPGHSDHRYWALLLGLILISGPGKLSIDHLLRKKFLKDRMES